jgi:hypothetical protein
VHVRHGSCGEAVGVGASGLGGFGGGFGFFQPEVTNGNVDLKMKQHKLKNVNNCLNTNIYSYLETSGGQSSNLYLNVVHFFNTSVL